MIKKQVIDFAILIDNDDLSPFDCYQIQEGSYRLFAAKGVKELSKLPFLLDNEERAETVRLKELYKLLYGKEMPVLMEVMSWSVVMRLAEEGLGIALAPDYMVEGFPNLKPVLPKLNPSRYKIYAVFEKNSRPSPHEEAFIKLLQT